MKIDEIIVENRVDEGPFLDKLKQAGTAAGTAISNAGSALSNTQFGRASPTIQGIKGALQGGKQGWQAGTGAVPGAMQGYAAGAAGAEGVKFQQQVAANKLAKWNQAVSQNPQILQGADGGVKALMDLITNEPSAQQINYTPSTPPTDMSPKGVSDYIFKTTGEIESMYNLGQRGNTAPPTQADTQASTQANTQVNTNTTPGQLSSNQLKLKGGWVMTKQRDGTWTDEQGDKITNPSDIAELDRRMTLKNQNRQMSQSNTP